jgi:L-malate glycosyltransferase
MAQDGKKDEARRPEDTAIVMSYSQNIGFSYHLCNLSIAMRKVGWRIFTFGPQMEQIPGLIDKLRAEDIGIEILGASDQHEYVITEIENSNTLRKFILKEKPKAILCNGFRQGLIAFIACFGLRRRPTIALTIHSSYYFESVQGRVMILLSVLSLDRIICLNSSSKAFVSNLPFGRSKVELIPNGLNFQEFDRLAESVTLPDDLAKRFENLDPKRPRMVYSAFMLPEKGHEDLLLALKKVIDDGMDPVLVFIGNGPRLEDVLTRIEDLGIQDSVFTLGKLDISLIPRIMKMCDIGVSSSYMEQFSYTILEYGAANLPILATNVGAADLVIKNGINGYLVEPGNIDQMASRIEDLLRNPTTMRSMGQKSREIVANEFSLDQVARQYLRVFEKG